MAIGIETHRPLITGVSHIASTGHYLATAAAYRILEQGGNATDAGVAAGLVLNVVLPQYTSFGGVAPILIYDKASNLTKSISGLGRWPKSASVEYFSKNHNLELPAGVLRTVTPSAADAWLTTLKNFGTMKFEEVVRPAWELAENGFPIPSSLHNALVKEGDKLVHDEGEGVFWSTSMDVFFRNGIALQTGQVLVQKDLANTFNRLIEVEKAYQSLGREEAIQSARDYFYKGEIAEEMVAFIQSQGGLLSIDDLAEFSVEIETPPSITYKDCEVYSCGPWCQGPVTLQTLKILETYDLVSMGHNSASYLHTVVEALKLAFADRHNFYGDPDFVNVPMEGLLSGDYAKTRAHMIDHNRAAVEMPLPGDPWKYQSGESSRGTVRVPKEVVGGLPADTSYISVVDQWGNAFSGTPSDGIGGGPTVPGLGFVISPRGSQSWLDEAHPSCLVPGKRPRLTPTPSMAFRNGRLLMPFGTPGGDVQCQSMVQLFLNVSEFGMNVQQAIEAPRISTWNFPNSFWPHAYHKNLIGIEGRIHSDTLAGLSSMGHELEVWDDWTPRMGALCAIEVDHERGALFGGADLRRDGYAIGR